MKQKTEIHPTQSLEEVLARVSQIKDPPQAKRQSTDQAAQIRESRIKELKARWNAPRRHVNTHRIARPEFDRALASAQGRLGSGCLMGVIGGYGPGKTQIGVELMRFVVETKLQPTLYTTAVTFFMALKATYKPGAMESEEDVLKRFTGPALLVVDEIGKRSDSFWENLLLFEMLDRRYRDSKDTVVIANQNLKEFAEGLGTALVSRMNEGGGIIECNWESFRA